MEGEFVKASLETGLDRFLADDRLRQGRVPYTILRPGRLTDDEPGSGRVRTEIGADGGFSISRDNVAACVEVALDSPAARAESVASRLIRVREDFRKWVVSDGGRYGLRLRDTGKDSSSG